MPQGIPGLRDQEDQLETREEQAPLVHLEQLELPVLMALQALAEHLGNLGDRVSKDQEGQTAYPVILDPMGTLGRMDSLDYQESPDFREPRV